MGEFFSMGGYAPFVWGSYAVAALVLLVMLAVSLSGLRRLERTLAVLQPSGGGASRKPSRRRNDTDGSAALLTTVAAGSSSGAIDCGSSVDAGCGGGGE